MELSQIINELGEDREHYFNATTPPLIQSSNFSYSSVAEMARHLDHEDEIPFYTRGVNPTTDMLQQKLAALEGTEKAIVVGSGSAAMAMAVLSQVKQGDHIICVRKPYSWTNKLLDILLPRFGVETTFVDGRDPKNFEEAKQHNTRLVILESPNSWTFEMQDVPAITKWTKTHGLVTIMDNSYCSPILYNPAKDGVDIIIHSATKYISGHSDAVAGVICCNHDNYEKIFSSEFMTLGPAISPFNSWLLLRGLRTLPLRIRQSGETTMKLVEYLHNQEKVDQVFFPFHPSHEQYELARKLFKGPAGQFTITLKATDEDKIEGFCNNLNAFQLACSWGGFESLQFPAMTLYRSKNYNKTTFPPNMVRLYTGLEEFDYLKNSFDKALEMI